MMVSEKVTERIRSFVCEQLRNQPDLSTLTLGILKKRYLVLVGLESLSPEARNYMKQVVKEELSTMQEIDENGVEPETEKPHNKRKREKENDDEEEESGIEDEYESTAKKSRRQMNSSSGSEGSAEEEKQKSGSEDAEQEVEKSQLKKSGNRKRKRKGEDSPVEGVSESGESDSEGPKDIGTKKNNSTKNTEASSSTRPGKETPQSDEENESDTERKSERSDQINESSDDSEKKEKVPVKKENNQDSDSSDDQETGTKKKEDKKKKKTVKKDENTSEQKDEHKQVVRLKRFISLCGVNRNYKKLLDGCSSVRSMVAVLKKELEDLGVQGKLSIKKCESVKRKREKAKEVSELDVSSNIPTQESEDNEGHKTGSEGSAEEEKNKSGSEDAEQEVEKSQLKKSGNCKRKREGEDSPVEGVSESGESDSEGPKDIGMKKNNSTKNTEASSSTRPGKETPQSDEENESDTERKSERSDQINESSDDSEKKEKVPVKKENNQDSDSSELTSLEDDQETGMKKKEDKKKKKTVKKDENTSEQKDEHKQVVRLKRYISLCGVKRNYKKLLDGCSSVRSMVAVLKKELEDLGVQGQPSIQKCKSVKRKREEAKEVAELDVSNIIPTPGRPTRRAASVRREGHDSPSSTYKHTLNSDSDEENRTHKVHRRVDWTNLRGIISDDADSD